MAQKENKEQNNTPDVENEEIKEQADQASPEAEAQEEQPDYQAIIDDLNDKVLRAAAEVQNIRRRADVDVQKAKNFSIEGFAKDLLGVMDNLYRATESISEEDAASDERLKSLREGVEITKKELTNVFERNHVKRIDPKGEAFDPNLHQAITQIADPGAKSGSVVQVMQTGYVIKDRVLRPALVVVAK